MTKQIRRKFSPKLKAKIRSKRCDDFQVEVWVFGQHVCCLFIGINPPRRCPDGELQLRGIASQLSKVQTKTAIAFRKAQTVCGEGKNFRECRIG
ncbi:MAG: hypothetical protein CK532_03175 [Flavobacteriales bacterium]|nr:MAG: hypothetical protein CK532_03175 [Flavobacteriales bacterium]